MDAFLARAFDVLKDWIPLDLDTYETLLQHSGAADRACYICKKADAYTYCLFSYPLYCKDGIPFHYGTDLPGSAECEQWILLVFDENGNVIADLAAQGMSLHELAKEVNRKRLEEESDWLYWQSEILLDVSQNDPSDSEAVLITNAYTSKRYRGQHIFHTMMEMLETAILSRYAGGTLLLCISLDPDVACYGEDKSDVPYIYSMKDEPVRLYNAEILRHMGWQAFKLETDAPVEDGAILWFAFHRVQLVSL